MTRTMTVKEWESLKAALPRFKWLDQIDRVKENCWSCDFYSGHEGKPGKCTQFDMDIPNDQRDKVQECFVQRVVPF